METQPIVLGTAGHIDHGKTALVRALTGIDTDRLKEEKERGITTELGFAHLDVGDRRFGLVDVPGHERFIKSMVAGAGGLDLVMLVIAADEGIMPQTREHLDICELLGVRRGLVALTKIDLVEPEWLEMVADEIRETLQPTFLGGAPVVPVSAKSGEGIAALQEQLLALTGALPARDSEGLFRLPLDRVFSIRGFGTVVTGTALGGVVRVGDAVVAHPRGLEAKVRGVEVHGEAAGEARAGMRCALNLTGVGTADLARGDLLAHPEALSPSHLLDASFRYLATSRAPLARRSRVLLHHGTAQLLGTLVLVDAERLDPGQEALVQLHLDIGTPLAALPADRFIVRGFAAQKHYGTTLGGGEIIRVHAPKVRRSSERSAAAIRAMAEAAGDDRVALEVKAAEVAGRTLDELVKRLGEPAAVLEAATGRLVARGDLVGGAGREPVFVHSEIFARLDKRLGDQLDAAHRAAPERGGVPRQELRGKLPEALPAPLFDALLASLVERERAVVEDDRVRPASAARLGAEPMTATEKRIERAFRDWGFTPPRVKDIPGELGLGPDEVGAAAAKLQAAGQLIKVKPDLYLHSGAIDELEKRLRAHLEERGEITPAEWKQITGATRKWSIPLAEYFDKVKLTLRVGDIRRLR